MCFKAIFIAFICVQAIVGIEINRTKIIWEHEPTTSHMNIYCVRSDRFHDGKLFLCINNAVYSYDIDSTDYSLIAGKSEYYDKGYGEGHGSDANFSQIYDVEQLNKTVMVVSDFENNCLRSIEDQATTMFAGNCTVYGYADGDRIGQAIFARPNGLLLVELDLLIIGDHYNNALRQLVISSGEVTTLVKGSYESPTGIYFPTKFVCVEPTCINLYLTVKSGLVKLNRNDGSTVILSGKVLNGVPTGSLRNTSYHNPDAVIQLNPNLLLVADFWPWKSTATRVLLLDLYNQTSEELFKWNPNSVNSFLCHNNILYMGTYNSVGLWKATVTGIDDFHCFSPTPTDFNRSTIASSSTRASESTIKSSSAINNHLTSSVGADTTATTTAVYAPVLVSTHSSASLLSSSPLPLKTITGVQSTENTPLQSSSSVKVLTTSGVQLTTNYSSFKPTSNPSGQTSASLMPITERMNTISIANGTVRTPSLSTKGATTSAFKSNGTESTTMKISNVNITTSSIWTKFNFSTSQTVQNMSTNVTVSLNTPIIKNGTASTLLSTSTSNNMTSTSIPFIPVTASISTEKSNSTHSITVPAISTSDTKNVSSYFASTVNNSVTTVPLHTTSEGTEPTSSTLRSVNETQPTSPPKATNTPVLPNTTSQGTTLSSNPKRTNETQPTGDSALKSKTGYTAGKIAGIAVGSVIGVAVLAIVFSFGIVLYRRNWKGRIRYMIFDRDNAPSSMSLSPIRTR